MGDLPSFSNLEQSLGYVFKNRELLTEALTHPSYCFENKHSRNYQRLEFLGDAILGAILGITIYAQLPGEREGKLASLRSILGSGQLLSRIAGKLGIAPFVRMSHVEIASSGQSRASTLEDTLEALIGAIYLDSSDFDLTRTLVLKWYGNIQHQLQECVIEHNPKGKLQEWIQDRFAHNTIEYRVTKTDGPSHQRSFDIEVWANGQCLGHGTGTSKKEAEEAAARMALQAIAKDS